MIPPPHSFLISQFLQRFKYSRDTIAYTDASVGSSDCPGGLGVVIVQKDEESKSM